MLYLIGEIIIFLLVALLLGIVLGALLRGAGGRGWRRELIRIRDQTDELEAGRQVLIDAGVALRTRLDGLEARSVQFAQRIEDSESDLAALGEFKNLFQVLNQAHAREKSRMDSMQTRIREVEGKFAGTIARLGPVRIHQAAAGLEGPGEAGGIDRLALRVAALEKKESGPDLGEAVERLQREQKKLAGRMQELQEPPRSDSRSDVMEPTAADLVEIAIKQNALERRVEALEALRGSVARGEERGEVPPTGFSVGSPASGDVDDRAERPEVLPTGFSVRSPAFGGVDDRAEPTESSSSGPSVGSPASGDVDDRAEPGDASSSGPSVGSPASGHVDNRAEPGDASSSGPSVGSPASGDVDDQRQAPEMPSDGFSVRAQVSPGRDNLRRIRGIGRVIERMLNEAGIDRIAQIAEWSEQDVAHYSEFLGVSGRIERDDWIQQARQLTEVES